MDSCDGLFAFATPDRRLRIMQDSHIGSFGIVGLVTLLLLEYSAIIALPEAVRIPSFVAMGALSRWSMVWATVRYPSARPDGLGHAYKASAQPIELVIGSLIAFLAILPLHLVGLQSGAVALVTTVLAAHLIMRRIHGLTGDTYGAISEVVEVAVLVGIPPLFSMMPT